MPFPVLRSYNLNFKVKKVISDNLTPLIFSIIYTAIFSIATILRYETFHASIFDLGTEINNLFLISRGYFFWFMPNGQTSHISILSGLFQILYIPLGLVYALIPHVSFFLFLQALLIGISAFPFYYLSRDILGKRWGFIGPILLLLNPQLHTGNMDDFHVSVFYVPFISFALYFAFKNKTFYLYLFSFLILIVKADSFLYITSIAIFMFLLGYKKKHVLILSAISWTYGLIMILYILPLIRGGITHTWGMGTIHPAYSFLTYGVKYLRAWHLKNLALTIINPIFINIKYNIRYLLYLLASLSFMPLFSKKMLGVMVLPLIVCWMAGFFPGHIYDYEPFFILQYSYFTVPFFVLAAIYGLHNVLDFMNNKVKGFLNERFSIIFIPLIIILTTIIQNYSSISNFGQFNVFNLKNYKYKNGMHPKSLNRTLGMIKSKYTISASNSLGSHLSRHNYIVLFPNGIDCANFIVFSTCPFIPYNKKRDDKLLGIFDSLKNSGKYDVVYQKGCNTILKLKKSYECTR